MQPLRMDRGTDALQSHLSTMKELEIRQTRRGWMQELMGCEARTEMRYFDQGNQIATSVEEANFWCRVCLPASYAFVATVREQGTDEELFTVDRPCKCPGGCGKCCCYQQITVSSGGTKLGSVKETCYYCVPMYYIYDDLNNPVYKLHPPTCCYGACFNCFTEGNPCCGSGCCKIPFWVFNADQEHTNGNAPHVGKILKKPKSLWTEMCTEANAFEVSFPENANVEDKALLAGTVLLLNAVHFERCHHE